MGRYFIFLVVFLTFFSSGYSQSFVNVASKAGINNLYFDKYRIPGGGVGFADFDNDDSDPDVITASYTHFKVYRNDNGQFTEVSQASGIVFPGDCLKSVVWGDYKGPGNREADRQVYTEQD